MCIRDSILCQFHRKYHPTFYSSIKVTQDPEIWRKALYDIARDVGDWCKDQNEEVEMISLTAQRTSIIPVDHKGDSLCDAVMWQDKRNIEVLSLIHIFQTGSFLWIKESSLKMHLQMRYSVLIMKEQENSLENTMM